MKRVTLLLVQSDTTDFVPAGKLGISDIGGAGSSGPRFPRLK